MAHIINFFDAGLSSTSTTGGSVADEAAHIDVAKSLIRRASRILVGLDGPYQRVGWLLEECSALICQNHLERSTDASKQADWRPGESRHNRNRARSKRPVDQ